MSDFKKSELKNQALLQRIAALTAEYENQMADVRVAFTMLNEEFEAYRKDIESNAEDTAALPVDE